MDGSADPGEDLTNIDIELVNTGDFDVTGTPLTATLTVSTPGAAVDPAFDTADYGTVLQRSGPPAVNATPFVVHTDLTLACPGVIDGVLSLTTDQGPLQASVTFRVDAPCDPCQPSWCADPPGAIGLLMAVRNGNDVGFSWQDDVKAISGYNIWFVDSKTDIADADLSHSPPATPSLPVPACAVPAPSLSNACTHTDGVTVPESLLFYQVKGYCSGVEGP